MSAFKLSNIWQEDIAINLSKLFSSNKSVEDNPTKTTSETVSLKDKQTAVTPKDGKINEQAFSGSANKLVTDLTKVFQGSVDKETSSAQEEPTDSEAIGLFPTIGLNQPEEGLRQKLGSFFSRTSKSKPKQSLTPPQSESVTSLDLNTEYRNGTPVPKQNDAAEKEPLRKHIAAGLGSNAGENGNRTLMVTCLETPSTEQIFDQSGLVEQNKSEVANHKGIKINSTTSAQYMGSGQSEEKCNGSAQTTDPTAPQKLRQISSSIPLQKDDNSSAYQRSLTKPQTVVDKCKEINSQVLEDGVNERDNVENENKMSVPRTITYSTYCGARRIRRRRTQKKPFQPLKPTISEVDERNLTSLDDQKEEETKQCVLLPAPEMTEIQTPLEEKIPLIMANESITMNRSNHGKGNDELQPRISIEKNSSNKHELTKDEKLENEAPMQQSSFSEIIKDMELTDLHQEITKIITDYNIVTIDHIKKQAIQSDTPVSNTTSRQKMTGVNPNDISAPSVPVAPEDFYSKGSSVPKMDTKYLAQKNSLIVDHNDLSHKNEDFIDTETATQTDSSPKTAVIVNPQQKAYIPSVSKSKNTNENKSNVPWAHGLTVDEVGASATQNFKPVNLNTLTSLENQKADNTDTQGKNIASNSAEDVALGLPLSIVFNQDDIEEQKTGPVSKGEKQAQMVDISDNVTADPTIVVSLTEPVKTIHLSKNVDTQKELRNDKNDVQLEIPSGTQIIEHTTVSETVTMFDDKRSIPDVCTNDMPEEQKGKDNITRLSTGSLTIETGYEIEKSPKKYNHAMQRSAATALTHVNEETPSEVPNRQINQNSTVLTTIEMINEARTEDTATSTNESTAINENDEVSKMPRIIDSTIAPVTASITIQLNGISNSEATITTEHEEIADSSYPQTEKSLHIQKPDQMYKTYSVNEHGHTSEVLQGTQDPFHEPKLPSTTRPSLLSESIFYRFYQESMELLDSAINTNSTSNNETVTMPVVKENQLIEEIHDNTETSNFVTMQQDANESSIETSRKCSPSENSLWYRCFQQSSGLLNTESNIQPNIISETNFENAWNNEMIQLTKPSTRIANFAEEVIQGTLEGDVLNNSRMTSCHEKDEEMAKKIAIHDKENSNSTNSDKPEDKEILLKITENKEGNISLQSGAEQMKVMCAIDATQALPAERVLTADNGDTLEGKAEEVKEKLVSSAVEMIPHTQLANITNKMGIINRKMAPDFIQNTGLMNSMKDIDLNECMNELTMNKMIEDEPEELKKILQIKDERRKVVVDSDLSAESENSSVQIPGEESKDSFLFTHENISEYVPLIHRPDEKNASIMVEPHEKNISTASLLPTDTDPTLVRSVKNNINQVAGTGHLNLTPTGYETGITESTVKTIEIDVNDCQVKEPEPAKETGQGTELRNTVDATKDSLSKAYLEIITTDNENSEPMSQEPPRVAAEQCNVPDGIQSAGILKTRSATSSQSNVSQESSIYDFKEIVTNPEAANFQPDSVPSKVSQYSFSVGQVDSMNQNTTLKEDGSDTLSEMQSSCKNSVSDSIKPLNGTPKRKIQEIQLSPEEAFKNIQVPDAVRLPQSDSGAACKSDMTVPSETKPVVDSESFTEPVTPYTQPGSIASKENIITAETGQDFTDNTRLMDKAKGIDLNESTINFTMNNSIHQEAEKLKKTLHVKDERLNVVMNSEVSEESEGNYMQIPGGENKDSPLFTHENISEYVPSIHRADEKNTSHVEPHEKNISTASLLPTNTDLTLVRSVKDNINQVAGTGHLNLTPTGYETGIRESTVKTIEINVNNCQVKEPDPTKEAGQGTEIRNTLDVEKGSFSETHLEIITTDNENFEHMAQEPSGTAVMQCNVPDGIQSVGILKTESATSSQSNVSQECSMSDFEEIVTNPEAANFQPDSVPSKVSQYSFSVGQVDSMNQNTTLKEDGSDTLSEMQSSCKNSVSDSIKPLNGTPKRKIQKIQLSPEEAFKNIQVPDAVRLPQSDSRAACKSDMTVPSETKPVVDSESFTEPVTPYAQPGSTASKENIITAETGQDFTDNTRLMDKAKGIDLNESTINFTMNNSIHQEAEKLKKTLHVKDERLNVVMNSEVSEESEGNYMQIPGGENKDSPLFTHENISEYVPSIHRADEKNASHVEPHEKSISTASLLPTNTDLTLVRSVKDNITQVTGTGHLNLTPTGYETGIRESTVKTIEINVNNCQVKEPDPTKEAGQGTEIRNTLDAEKGSFSETHLEIITTDNENFEHMAQEPSGTAVMQCNVPERIQSAGILKTESATSSQSNASQECSMSDFEEIVTNPEAANFQPDSVPSKVSQYSFSVGQVDSMNQNTTLKEDGSDTLSEMQSSCKNSVSDSIKPLNGTPKRKIQKIQLSPEEAFKNIQVPDAVQLPQTDSGAACKSDMTVPSETKPVVDSESFTEPVTPYTQPGSIASKENIITAETGQDFTDNTRLMDKAKGIDLNESTINFTMNNSIHQEAEKLKKTLHVKDERLKVLVDSEVSEVSEGDSVQIPRGGNKDSPLFTHENISEYVPSIHRADEKNASHVESHEKSISTASLLPTNTDLTLVRSVKDNITQVTGTGHLNLTPTGYETGITESTVKTIEINVNNCQVKIPDPTKETGQGTEIRNTMDAAKDFLSKTPLEVIRTDNEHFEPMAQEPSAGKIDQCDIADPLQSVAAVFKAKSVTKSVSNGVQEHLMSDYEKSKSGQLANPSYFINTSLKTVEEDDTRISGLQTTVDDVFADIRNSQVTKGIELIDYHLNNEKEMVPEFLEQEALILDQSLGCSFRSQKYFPFGLPPIYEEQELENEAIMDVYSIAHSPTSITQHSSNHPVTSLAEPTAVSVPFVQTQVIVEDAEKEEQNPTSPAPAVDVSTSLSNDNLNKPTAISQEISGKQNLSSQLQTDTCEVDSKISHNPGSSAGDSVFYRYFQSSKNYLPNAKEASLPSTSKILTDLQHKPIEDSKLLKCSSDSKGLVGNKSLKINPRPGKVVIYDQLNFHGNKREIFTDVPDATSWIFSEGISLIVVRGCWILYEKPEFQGQTYILEEGHRELDELWVDKNLQMKPTTIKNVIGSIKRIVKNHCIPEIAIFQEPQQNEIKMYLHSEVTCLEEFGIPSTVSSLIVNSGIWLAYYKANFGGHCTLLEAGNSSAPPSTELTLNNIKSLRPLEMGGLKVERPMAPKVIIFEKTFFNGHSKEICKDTSNLKSLWEDVPDLNINDINGVGSVRVLGGVWVCYEKECYSGHQYLLEEGEYADWQAWGGFDSTVQSMRYIQADYMKPEITLFVEADLKGEKTVFVNHDIPNLEIVGHGTVTQSIEVKNGVWVVYHEEHYCGKQYILEKGVYRNYTDWGGNDGSIMSIRPIQLELVGGNEVQFQLQAFNRVDFQGESVEFVTEIPSLPSSQLNSFKVLRGCWVLYDGKDYSGHQYVLEEGHYPDLDSLGCLSTKPIQSLKPIRYDFSMPSISLFSVCSFEGQELILTEGINCWKDKGYYQMPKSVKVNSGIWIAYEHANFRGRQFLLESTEITNWNEFSEGRTIGSIRLLEQPRVYFQIKNKATGGFLTVDGDAKDPKGSKLSVCPYNGKTTQMWFYCNGLIQSKANYTCIDTIGSQGKAGTRVILWTEHSRTHQKWNINRDGTISSFLDFNLRLDIKGGYSYDKHHIILNSPEEEQQTQFWDIEVMR
ncbi:uncharacterized protein [Chiloscyllium punctatum]|uniref:uncharacterized protein n=1 Tax=Chiloscyllium punctatum TaxID=137246 RepID=UPI003B640945